MTDSTEPATHSGRRKRTSAGRLLCLALRLGAGYLFVAGLASHAQPSNLTVSGTPSGVYVATNEITTANSAVVNTGVSVTFQAGVEIILNPGFHAVPGSSFYAMIAPTAPAITSLSPASATAGSGGFTLTVNGANFASGSVSFNGTFVYTTFVNSGQLTAWIPTSDLATAGSYPVTVTTGAGTSSPQYFTVNPVVPALSITTGANLTGGTVSTPYSLQLSASGGVPPYSWSLVSGALPNGLSLPASGLLSGIPTVAATFGFTLQVADNASHSASQPFSLAISQSASSPTITGITQNGAQITIAGTNLGTSGTVYFNVNGTNVGETATSWSPTQVVATLPGAGVQSVSVMGVSFAFIPSPPSNLQLSLSSGPPQMGFVITGNSLGSTAVGGSVTIGGQQVIPSSWTAAGITVQVPTGLAAVSQVVAVTVGGQAATTNFTVTGAFGCGN